MASETFDRIREAGRILSRWLVGESFNARFGARCWSRVSARTGESGKRKWTARRRRQHNTNVEARTTLSHCARVPAVQIHRFFNHCAPLRALSELCMSCLKSPTPLEAHMQLLEEGARSKMRYIVAREHYGFIRTTGSVYIRNWELGTTTPAVHCSEVHRPRCPLPLLISYMCCLECW
jgi:hypothetical protein